jgi:4-amino-4-deoxy-L-arabinose transferase-like glycosyltransferase
LLALVAIVVFGFALRAWGLGFALPYVQHPDEARNLNVVLRMFREADANPRFFHYPSLFFYLNLLPAAAYFTIGDWFGLVGPSIASESATVLVMGVGFTHFPGMFLASRWLTLLLGTGSIVLAYLLAKRVLDGIFAPLLATAFVSLSPLLVAQSRFATPDMLATFFGLVAALAATRILERGRLADYLLAGAAVGVAASCKYNLALLGSGVVTAHLLRAGLATRPLRNLLVTPAAAVLGFVAASPFVLFDSHRFFSHLRHQATHYTTGHLGMEGAAPLYYALSLLEHEGLVFPLALAAAVLAVLRRSKPLLLLVGLVAPYLFFVGSIQVRNERTLLPVIPLLFVLAADTLRWFFARERGIALARRPIVKFMVSAAVVVWPLSVSIYETARATSPDSRQTARRWIVKNVPRRARVAVDAYSVYVDPRRYKVQGFYSIAASPARGLDRRFDYLVLSHAFRDRYLMDSERFATQLGRYERRLRNFELVKRFDDGGYRIDVYRNEKARGSRNRKRHRTRPRTLD